MALLNVGMPGVGLGGIFYLVAALAMPVVEAARALRARVAGARRPRAARRWGLALRQAAIALATLGATWGAGLGIARWRPAERPVTVAHVETAAVAAPPMRAGTLLLGGLLLVVVLGAVELLRLATRRRPAPAGAR
jgi:hypothetical protein